jgi:hypothetical protein
MMALLALPALAGPRGELQKYFSDTAGRVKATDDPSEKRAILKGTFQRMTAALDMVQGSAALSQQDRLGIERLRTALQEKQDELAGVNGFARVPDQRLNAFSEYVVQDMEQAELITISLLTLVLIVIILILLF